MIFATMTDQEALISKLCSHIIRKRLNTMIRDAGAQGAGFSAVGTKLPFNMASRLMAAGR
jgi:hypothetical protein